ncbi:MAG: xanthine dehydrogenase family protein molybdopterin-binding subunit [Candidatus Cloacimonadota bacterium]|nr:xanthine dehydrogenase family protein molybdopterin-binding subunit [Candidatus Cloacimonadota bacterium]
MKQKKKFDIVGKNVKRTDAYEKVTGRAKYGADLEFPEMLLSDQFRLDTVHAKIKSIDILEAEKVAGISAIITHKDVPGKNYIGVLTDDQPIFSSDKIFCAGDVIALVVGKSENAIQKAKSLIKVEYAELPILADYTKALEPDAPLIHPEMKSNQIVHYPLRKGNVNKGFAESEFILEREYTTQTIEHAYIEPEVVVAVPHYRKDVYKIYGSFQNPFTSRKIIAKVMGLPLTKIHIIQAEIGGAFGGKDDSMNIIGARACVACRKINKPVKLVLSRESDIIESYKRHPYKMKYKVGYNPDGRLIAMKIDILADGGAYASMSPFVTWRSVVQATGPYKIKHVETDVRAVYSNNPYTGAMRGFGSPQIIFAQESLMDEIAENLSINPVEIRKINGVQQDSVTTTGQKLDSHKVSLFEVIDKARKEADFLTKFRQNEKNQPYEILESSELIQKKYILDEIDFSALKKTNFKGIGISCSLRGCSLGAEGVDASGALVSVQNDGSVYLLTGLAENGQGLRTTFSIVLAEILGLEVSDVFYLDYNTSNIMDGGPTVASRSTLVGGEAVADAGNIIRKRIENVLCKEWKLDNESDFNFSSRRIIENISGKEISFADACFTAYQSGINLSAYGWFNAPDVSWDEKKGQGLAYFTYVYGCQIAEVEVNISTGQVFVKNITAVHDAGKIINKLGALGQVYGGVATGAGYGMMEELIIKKGKIQNTNLDEYLIPTSLDIGNIDAYFVEYPDKFGPFGAKSLGEPTLELTAAAINNAVSNAIGKRNYNLPLDLEQIKLGKPLYVIKSK